MLIHNVKSTIPCLFILIQLISLPHQTYKRSYKHITNSPFLHLLLLENKAQTCIFNAIAWKMWYLTFVKALLHLGHINPYNVRENLKIDLFIAPTKYLLD